MYGKEVEKRKGFGQREEEKKVLLLNFSLGEAANKRDRSMEGDDGNKEKTDFESKVGHERKNSPTLFFCLFSFHPFFSQFFPSFLPSFLSLQVPSIQSIAKEPADLILNLDFFLPLIPCSKIFHPMSLLFLPTSSNYYTLEKVY